jgi:hypothetical protein
MERGAGGCAILQLPSLSKPQRSWVLRISSMQDPFLLAATYRKMLKNLLRSRHDAPTQQIGGPPAPRYACATNQPQACARPCTFDPVEYKHEGPVTRPVGSTSSINPVEYCQSPFGAQVPPLPREAPSSAFSINPVEYRQSPSDLVYRAYLSHHQARI